MYRFISILFVFAILSGCVNTQTENLISDKYADHKHTLADSIDEIAVEEASAAAELSNISIKAKELIQLNFSSNFLNVISPLEKDSPVLPNKWTYIQSLPFGTISDNVLTLEIYKVRDSNADTSRTHGILQLGNHSYLISDIATELELDNLSSNELGLYQRFFSKQEQYLLIGYIELFSNGPGLKKYVVYDTENAVLLDFDAWGTPDFIDLNNDTYEEFVIQFHGLHNNLPDIAFIDFIDYELKISYSVFENLEKQQGDYAIIKYDRHNNPFIFLSNLLAYENQDIGFNYRYLDGHLELLIDN